MRIDSSSKGGEQAAQLAFDDRALDGDGVRRGARMRRVAAMLAPAATDAGAIVSDERLLEIAQALSEAFGRPAAAAGLTHGELVAALRVLRPSARSRSASACSSGSGS